MGKAVEIQGQVAEGFERVRDTFEENFKKRGELGARFTVTLEGQTVVDLWGGTADIESKRDWDEHTLTMVFSSTKGMVALCFLLLADRGLLDYDAPVASYWPEFGVKGKEAITVRELLNHRAGLITVDTPVTLEQLESDEAAIWNWLAEQEPAWNPGDDQGYHAVTYGMYAQALFQKIAGQSLGSFFATEVAGPLGADAYLGLPDDEHHRVATTYRAPTSELVTKAVPKLFFHSGLEGRVFRKAVFGGDTKRAFSNPAELGPKGLKHYNSPLVRRLELPWMNLQANGAALARIYSALANEGRVDGVELVSAKSIAPILERQSWSEMDRVLRKPMGWSQGFVKEELDMFSPNPEAFGHPGAGGALGWCDPVHRLSFGYSPNRMAHHVRSPRARALCKSVYDAIAKP